MRHVAIVLLSAHFPNKNQRVVCEDSAKRKMISVSPLANRGTEVMKRYCTAAGDSTLVLEKIVQTFLYVSVDRRSSFESRSKVDSKVIRTIVYFFFVFSFKRGRSSKLAVGPRFRRTKIVSISGHTRREQRKNWYSFAESMAEFRCTVVTDPERRSKTNTANNNFSQISRGIVRPLEIASKTSKAFT